MGPFAAKQGDQVSAMDTHIVMVPSPPGPPVATPLPHPFSGLLDGALSTNVNIMGRPAAVAGSTARNQPPHLPTPPGSVFQKGPGNQATVQGGSRGVNINGKPAARHGDAAITCNDPADQPVGKVVATGSVRIG